MALLNIRPTSRHDKARKYTRYSSLRDIEQGQNEEKVPQTRVKSRNMLTEDQECMNIQDHNKVKSTHS